MDSPVDVLIVTALKDELDALLDVTREQVEWQASEDSPRWAGSFDGRAGPLRVVATWLPKMGPLAAVGWTGDLVDELGPRALAMCGVCAGHPQDTTIGDVIIAERVFEHDEGKRTQLGFQGDLWVRNLSDDWILAAQGLGGRARAFPGYGAATEETGRLWFLEQLLAGREPWRSKAFSRYIGDRAATLTALEAEGLIKHVAKGGFRLLAPGRDLIQRHLDFHGAVSDTLPYAVHVAPIGSGSAVEADPNIWGRIENSGMRKTLGVEMEGAAIGYVAARKELPFVVVKGVMDHADKHKADGAKAFAARASAAVLVHFLRRVVEPAGVQAAFRVEVAPRRGPGGPTDEREDTGGRGRGDYDARRRAVLAQIIKILSRSKDVVARLTKANPSWASTTKPDMNALARAILGESATVLAELFLKAARDTEPNLTREEAEVFEELLAYALPFVISFDPLLWQAAGRWNTRVRTEQTLEAHMAWEGTPEPDLPRLTMLMPERQGDHPIPLYCVPIRKVPEAGAILGEQADVVAREVRVRQETNDEIEAIGKAWHGRVGGLDTFLGHSPGDRGIALSQDVQASRRKQIYGLVREPDEADQRFIDRLHAEIPNLRVVEAWPQHSDASQDYHLLAHLRALYTCFLAAGLAHQWNPTT